MELNEPVGADYYEIRDACIAALKSGAAYELQIDGGLMRAAPSEGLYRFMVTDPGGLCFGVTSPGAAADCVLRHRRLKNYAPRPPRVADPDPCYWSKVRDRLVSDVASGRPRAVEMLDGHDRFVRERLAAVASAPDDIKRFLAEVDAMPTSSVDLTDLVLASIAA